MFRRGRQHQGGNPARCAGAAERRDRARQPRTPRPRYPPQLHRRHRAPLSALRRPRRPPALISTSNFQPSWLLVASPSGSQPRSPIFGARSARFSCHAILHRTEEPGVGWYPATAAPSTPFITLAMFAGVTFRLTLTVVVM